MGGQQSKHDTPSAASPHISLAAIKMHPPPPGAEAPGITGQAHANGSPYGNT